MKKNIFLFVLLTIITFYSSSAQKLIDTGDAYMGQKAPGDSAEIFAPGRISNALINRDVAITPDGREMYFGMAGRVTALICYSKFVDGKWSDPEIAPFSGSKEYFDFEPHISPDGKHFYFLSTRPKAGMQPKPGWVYQDIWVMDRESDKWGEPYNLGEPVNTEEGEYYPSATKNGKLYFTREINQKSFIYRSELKDGKFTIAKRVPLPIDTLTNIFNAFISPDEEYLIFCSNEIKDKIGITDYYISFRSNDDKWSKPMNMGPVFNSKGDAASSMSLSPDGKYLFFASNRSKSFAGKGYVYKNLVESSCSYLNGSANIYWISSGIINRMKNEAWK